jgi:hypothetical protein
MFMADYWQEPDGFPVVKGRQTREVRLFEAIIIRFSKIMASAASFPAAGRQPMRLQG